MPNQYFAALTNMRSVGVMGDERTYDYAVALRAVNTIDFMTAESAQIPFEVLQTVMSRIINEVRGVNRVFYDLTSKPPGTIEFRKVCIYGLSEDFFCFLRDKYGTLSFNIRSWDTRSVITVRSPAQLFKNGLIKEHVKRINS